VAKNKYDKHFFPNPLIKADTPGGIAIPGVKHRIVMQGSKTGFGGLMKNYWLRWTCYTEPVVMGEPHSHNFDEIMHFFGADASDISDFQAVVEFSMGKEQEVHTFTTPFIVYIPAGMVHSPINIKVVKKPIIFMNISNTSGYESTSRSGTPETPRAQPPQWQ
jgi:hypothetical protein